MCLTMPIYNDHKVEIEILLPAISRAEEIIEKHFKLEKSNTAIQNNALSTTP